MQVTEADFEMLHVWEPTDQRRLSELINRVRQAHAANKERRSRRSLSRAVGADEETSSPSGENSTAPSRAVGDAHSEQLAQQSTAAGAGVHENAMHNDSGGPMVTRKSLAQLFAGSGLSRPPSSLVVGGKSHAGGGADAVGPDSNTDAGGPSFGGARASAKARGGDGSAALPPLAAAAAAAGKGPTVSGGAPVPALPSAGTFSSGTRAKSGVDRDGFEVRRGARASAQQQQQQSRAVAQSPPDSSDGESGQFEAVAAAAAAPVVGSAASRGAVRSSFGGQAPPVVGVMPSQRALLSKLTAKEGGGVGVAVAPKVAVGGPRDRTGGSSPPPPPPPAAANDFASRAGARQSLSSAAHARARQSHGGGEVDVAAAVEGGGGSRAGGWTHARAPANASDGSAPTRPGTAPAGPRAPLPSSPAARSVAQHALGSSGILDEDGGGAKIRVVVRKRPLNGRERRATERGEDADIVQVVSRRGLLVHESRVKVDLTRYVETHDFAFDEVFEEGVNTEDVYRHTARPLVAHVFRGSNATCFAYGQTGCVCSQLSRHTAYPSPNVLSPTLRPRDSSGKTYTMMGNVKDLAGATPEEAAARAAETPGLYVLAARDIFARLQFEDALLRPATGGDGGAAQPDPAGSERRAVVVSFFEIYGGKLFDLLAGRSELKALVDHRGEVQIVGLSEQRVSGVEPLLRAIDHGNRARSTGSTGANEDSSRSHAVLVIGLATAVADGRGGSTLRLEPSTRRAACNGKISFIDLAGSERGADTTASDRKRRLEGAEINKSLLALKECIRSLYQEADYAPFRGSKLTQVRVSACVCPLLPPPPPPPPPSSSSPPPSTALIRC